MSENETGVAPEATSPEPAKTAELDSAGGARASSPGAEASAADETNVSIIAVVRGYLAEHPIEEWLEPKLEQLKREILAKVSELVTPIVAKSTEAELPRYRSDELVVPPPVAEPHELAVGDPVKVWADAVKKNFHLGVIDGVHEGGGYDVRLDGGGHTYIRAGGLEFDDRR